MTIFTKTGIFGEKTMSNKMNLNIHINAYDDETATNSPSRSNVKWNREMQGIDICEPESKSIKLQANQEVTLFSGTVSTNADITTTWDLSLKAGSTNIYRIQYNIGTAPDFRIARVSGADATTEVTITKNAKLLTYTSTGGTLFDLLSAGAIVGDEVRIAGVFNAANQGKFKIIAITATSFTVENEIGVAETGIVLGALFATNVNIYSTDGVQINDKTDIIAGFSLVTFGTYDIVDVSHDYIEIYSNESLPEESGISNNPSVMEVYRDAKQFLYMESDKHIEVTINDSLTPNEIIPFQIGSSKKSGVFMSKASLKSCKIKNKSQETANIFYVSAE